MDSLLQRVDSINENATLLEDNFSYTLGEGSRWLEHLVMEILFTVALTVEISGLLFSILLSRNITRGLNEIIQASDKIKRGDLSVRATAFSNDEIGQVALSINQMAEQLIFSNEEFRISEEEIKKARLAQFEILHPAFLILRSTTVSQPFGKTFG